MHALGYLRTIRLIPLKVGPANISHSSHDRHRRLELVHHAQPGVWVGVKTPLGRACIADLSDSEDDEAERQAKRARRAGGQGAKHARFAARYPFAAAFVKKNKALFAAAAAPAATMPAAATTTAYVNTAADPAATADAAVDTATGTPAATPTATETRASEVVFVPSFLALAFALASGAFLVRRHRGPSWSNPPRPLNLLA